MMKAVGRLLGFVLCLGWVGEGAPADGQSAPGEAVAYTHRSWLTDDGLPQNGASALAQTRDGYLWVGTWQGLARFDGMHFATYEAAGTEGLESDRITALFEDRDGTLWIGTETVGVSRYRDGVFETLGKEAGLPCLYVQAFYPGWPGDLWVECPGGVMALGRSREGRMRFTTDHGLPPGRIRTLLASAVEPGTLWIGSDRGAIRVRGEERVRFTQDDRAGRFVVHSIGESRDGTVWFGTNQGITRFSRGRLTDYPIDGHHTVVKIFEDSKGNVWAVVEGRGLFRFDGSGFTQVAVSGDPVGPNVVSALEDREGSLWVGTNGNGLHRLKHRLFTAYTVEDGLPGHQLLAVYEDRAGGVWAGTSQNGLARIKDGTVRTFTVSDGLPSNRIWTLGEDAEGTLWVGADGGLSRYDGRRFIVETTATVRAIARGRSGDVWFTAFEAVHRLRASRSGREIDEGTAVPVYPLVVHEDANGTLWIGTSSDGLCRLGDGLPTCYTTADGLSSNTVRAIFEAAPDTLWLGTYGGGLCRFTAGSASCMTRQHGLPDGTIHHVLADGLGFVWLPSNKGVFRLARRDVARFFAGEIDRVFPTVYGQADGMPSSECNGGFQPAGWKARDGRLWFPTTRGLAVIDPARGVEAAGERVDPPVHVEQLTVDGSPRIPSPGMVLEAGSDRLTFSFTAPYLGAPEKVRFRYRLDAHDHAWIAAGAERQATYTNLPPGAYTFRVQVAVGNGPWVAPGAEQAFSLRPFLYQTWWFLGCCGLLLSVLTVTGYRLRVRQMKQRQRRLEATVAERTERLREEKRKTEAQARRLAELDEAKNRFFANISHEFRTPLTLILGALDQAPKGGDGRDAAALRDAMIRANAERLLHLVSQLLDLARVESGGMRLRKEAGDLVHFLRSLVLAFTPLAERKGIRLRFQTHVREASSVFDPDALQKIVGNLLSNALKFTPEGGKVWVTLHAGPPTDGNGAPEGDDGPVEITVKDTGPGIPVEALPRIFDRFRRAEEASRRYEGTGIGLALVRELVGLHGGEIFVESEPGFGSAFTVRLPRLEPVGDEHVGRGRSSPRPPAKVVSAALVEGAAPEAREVASPGAPTVLVVEDNADVRALVRDYLEPDYRVVEAEGGREALEAAREATPDLILSDVMMPGMDGIDLVRAVKQDERLRTVPVILLTARAAEQDAVDGLSSGADDYLAKPFSAGELRARVARHIEVRRRLREQYSKEVRVAPAGIPVASSEVVFLKKVEAEVEARMGDARFGPQDLAGALGVSPRQLRRRLRAVVGESPAKLILRFRLERAARLLEQGGGTVAEVAFRVGFKNADHFSTAFRRRFGTAPSRWNGHDSGSPEDPEMG